jgi:hypothetical protein
VVAIRAAASAVATQAASSLFRGCHPELRVAG